MHGGVKNWSLHSLLLWNGCDLWSHRRNSGISFWGRQGFGRIGGHSQKVETLWIWSKLPMCIYIYINIYTIHWYFDDSPTFSEAKIPRSYLHVFLCTQKKCLRKVGRHIFSLHSGRGPVGWVHQEDQGWSNGWWVSDCFGRSLPWVGKLTVNLPKTNSLGCTWKNGWKLGNCILSLFGGLPNFRYLC